MESASVLLLVRTAPAPDVAAALKRALTPFLAVSAGEVLAHVRKGTAHTVVLERAPGWVSFVHEVERAGASALVVGPDSEGAEDGELPPGVEWVQDLNQLVPSLERAKQRRMHERRGLDVGELLERALTAERINRFSQTIAAQVDMHGLRREVLHRVRELCESEDAALFLVDPETGELVSDPSGFTEGTVSALVRLQPGDGVVGRAALRAGSELVGGEGQAELDPIHDAFTATPPGSVVASSLLRAGDVVGVVAAVRALGRPGFEPLHLRRLEDLGRHLSLSVHNLVTTLRLREAQTEVLQANLDLEQKVRERTEQISRAKAEWERTFDAIRQPIALQDGFVLRRVNQAYAERARVPLKELPGKKCHEVFAGRSTPCGGCPLLRGRDGELSGEVTIASGTIYQFAGFWNSPDAKDPRVVVNYRDVTGQKTLESRLRESERLAALGQLASGAAHEINNPLGFVISNLRNLRECMDELREANDTVQKAKELCAQGKQRAAVDTLAQVELGTPAQDGLEMIDESLEGTKRVAAIVRGLRELSRQEIGKPEPADVNASVTRAVRAEFGDAAPKVRLDLCAQRAALIPPLQLDQVLGHILRNAHQAVGEGLEVTVRTLNEDGEVRIEVEDRGPGIAPENVHRIFEPFFTTRGVGKGIGLGLTAAYGIVRRNNGNIDVKSKPGHGATFVVRLTPSAPPDAKAERTEPQRPSSAA